MRETLINQVKKAGILLLAVLPVSLYADLPELQPPVEFSYGADGITRGELKPATSAVQIGGQTYNSQVFNGRYDSPLIRTRPGGIIKLRLNNQLTDITNLHFHGMQVSPLDHGDNIFALIQPGEVWDYELKLPDDHPPGLYWYHSHFNKGSERQVSGGIAGPIIVDGLLDQFPELKDVTERVFVLRNFQKTLTGNLASNIITGAPSIRTVNGQVNTRIDIQPGETEIWQFFNIAANQYFRIYLAGQPFTVLAWDGNTVTRSSTETELLIGPSARVTVLVNGPEAGRYPLEVLKVNTGPIGDYYPEQLLATLVSAGDKIDSTPISSTYPVVPDLRDAEIAVKRSFTFQDSNYDPNLFLINGAQFNFTRVNTTVKLGDTEEWVLYNPSAELHQFHIHQTDFQVVKINGKPVPFTGYRDNIYIPVNGSVTVRIPFLDPVILGKFVYHCHILEHEDGGMMAVVQVVKPEDYEKAVTLERVGGIYGDENQMCAYLRYTGKEKR